MTTQIPDTLHWREAEYLIPNGGPLLQAWPEGRRPEFEMLSTACWRGFIGTWLIDDEGWLRLVSVRTGVTVERLQSEKGRKNRLPSRAQRRAELREQMPDASDDVVDQMLAFSERMSKQPDLRVQMGVEERLFDLFPGHDGPVAATWFSGGLRATSAVERQDTWIFQLEEGRLRGEPQKTQVRV